MSFNQRDVDEIFRYADSLNEKGYIKYQNLADEAREAAEKLAEIVHKASELYDEVGF